MITTIEPCEKLIRDLNLSPGDKYTQDWVCEVSDFRKMETFLTYYREKHLNSEEKRALITIILDSYEEYVGVDDYNFDYSEEIKRILEDEYELFEDIIQYWSCEGEEMEGYCFLVTPIVREVREAILFRNYKARECDDILQEVTDEDMKKYRKYEENA